MYQYLQVTLPPKARGHCEVAMNTPPGGRDGLTFTNCQVSDSQLFPLSPEKCAAGGLGEEGGHYTRKIKSSKQIKKEE